MKELFSIFLWENADPGEEQDPASDGLWWKGNSRGRSWWGPSLPVSFVHGAFSWTMSLETCPKRISLAVLGRLLLTLSHFGRGVGLFKSQSKRRGWRGNGVGSLKQRKDVPLNVSDGTIIMFHGAGGVACKGGCKHTRRFLANIKGVRKGCTLSPSGLNALRGKDNVCRGGSLNQDTGGCNKTKGKNTDNVEIRKCLCPISTAFPA